MLPRPVSHFLLSTLLSLHLAAQPPGQRAEVIPITSAIPEDADLQKVLAPLAAEIRATFDLPLVQAPQGLFRGRRGEENRLGYWVADVMRAAAEGAIGKPVRFAITNAGGLRANLRRGQLKVADIYEVMPFENELLVIELTGAEVIQVVKESIVRRGGEPWSGVRVVLGGTPAAPTCTITWADGSPLDPAAVVSVATSDFLYAGGDTTPTLKQGRRPFTTGLTLRQVLLDECGRLAREKKDLLPPAPGRCTIPVPIQDAIRDRKFRF